MNHFPDDEPPDPLGQPFSLFAALFLIGLCLAFFASNALRAIKENLR